MGRASRILYPKREGFTGKERPLVLILSSAHDKVTTAVRYTTVETLLDERGYTCINKKQIHFFTELNKSIVKPTRDKKEITIWLESHGAPGWLFGAKATESSEIEATIAFATYIRSLAKYMGVRISDIVLSSCYSANEFADGFSVRK
ncbi:hypothetical protein M1146_05235, partial [Patescibacteria group bacterium]|nr:hypothetical protein [Patescibacteria group bacterium]